MEELTVAWFSSGVSSAVATKLAIMDGLVDRVIYTHISDQHPDTIRFIKDCEAWFGVEVEILQSSVKSVEAACLGVAYVNGPAGAACTRILKRRVRKEWEDSVAGARLSYVWGMDVSEKARSERIVEAMPDQRHLFPLIEKSISKEHAHQILNASGIKRPMMYDLGYRNNNCVGCVKGGMGYWNMIREDFPEVFASRARMEREVGASCINGVFLDDLDPAAGRKDGPVCEDCGIFCEIMGL